MKALFLTNEYPPHTYGGAGVHVDYLSRELAKLIDVEVRAFSDQHFDADHLKVRGFPKSTETYTCPKPLRSAFAAVSRCVDFNTADIDADVVHCHTWYSQFGGIMAKLNYGLPLVVTVHSLEPLRPWKREQLGGGYDFTCWIEKTAMEMADAVVAVSRETKADVLRLFDVDEKRVHIIYNGIDPDEYHAAADTSDAVLEAHGIDPQKPFLLFVGRIARQKGIIHLVHAIKYLEPGTQVVLCAGAPDTPEIAAEMQAAVADAKRQHGNVIWIEKMLDKPSVISLYGKAAVFCCPSIYEPFGIINLEAMACETAVVASAVGGIKEVVVHGETGFLVPLDQMQESPFEPVDPDRFARDLAARIDELMSQPELRARFAKGGRARARERFSWASIAMQTRDLYESLTPGRS